MKANEFLRALCQENLNLDFCGVAFGETINAVGVKKYFGSKSSGIGIKNEFDYFYYYEESDYDFSFMPTPSVVLPDTESGEGYSIYLWEIDK